MTTVTFFRSDLLQIGFSGEHVVSLKRNSIMTTLTLSNSTINVSNTQINGETNQITGDHNNVSGFNNEDIGSFNQLHGDESLLWGSHNTVIGNNELIVGPDGLLADPVAHGGNYNVVKGNNEVVGGNGNKLTGDNNAVAGDANVLHDVKGGTVKMAGDNNFLYANHNDAISLISGTGNELDFAGAKQGTSSVDKFVSGDEILVGKGQKTSLSSAAAGTTLHIASNNHEYDVLFSGTDLATVKDSMHVAGNHVTLPTFNG